MPRSYALLGLIPLLVGLGAILLTGFDGLYGQDPFAYYDYAAGPLREHLLRLAAPPPFFWPPGYPLLAALPMLAFGPTPAAAQAVSLLAGALTPVFTAAFAAELYGRGDHRPETEDRETRDRRPRDQAKATRSVCSGLGSRVSGLMSSGHRVSGLMLSGHRVIGSSGHRVTPLIAGLLVACTGQLWQSSVVIMADTSGLAAATFSGWMLARYGRTARLADLLLAVAGLAVAITCRWAYALVALPFAAYTLVLLAQRGLRLALAHALPAALLAAALLGPLFAPGLVALVEPAPGAVAPFAGSLQVYHWDVRNALQREFVTSDGLLRYSLPNGLWYLLAPARPIYVTPLLALLIVPGLLAVLRRRAAAPWLLLLGWVAVVYAFHAGAPWQNFRFTLAYLPPLAVLAAIGVASLATIIANIVQPQSSATTSYTPSTSVPSVPSVANPLLFAHTKQWRILLVLPGLAWMCLAGAGLLGEFTSRKASHLATVRWAQGYLPGDARLLSFNLTQTLRHYSGHETIEIYDLTPAALDRLLADQRPTFLLIDTAEVTGQWAGRSPDMIYRHLRDGPGLTPLGTSGVYSLFRVQ